MCRFVAYIGQDKLLLDEVLSKPENSLIRQSIAARGGTHGVNADGFGVAWYTPEIDDSPGVFKSIQPAWNDANLHSLSSKLTSKCFLAHVRASTVGDVSQSNCHPFAFDRYAFVHNGTVMGFEQLKRPLFDYIEDDLFHCIKGNTDSECFFMLVMHYRVYQQLSLLESVKAAIQWISETKEALDILERSRLNIVLTDGKELVATRYASHGLEPLSVYYRRDRLEDGGVAYVVSSEPLTSHTREWTLFPENSYLHISCDLEVAQGSL